METAKKRQNLFFHIFAASKFGDTASVITIDTFKDMITTTVSSVNQLLKVKVNAEEQENNIQILMNDAFTNFAKTDPGHLNYEEFSKWAESNSQVVDFFEFLLHKGYKKSYLPSSTPSLPDVPPPLPGFFLESGTATTSDLLNSDSVLGKLRDSFGHRFWNFDFELLYKPSIHGYSLKTMYSRCTNRGAAVVVVKDSGGHHFGGFCSTGIKIENSFGDQNCFLFQSVPEYHSYHPDSNSSNSNFVSAFSSYFAFGGPEFGIWIDQDVDKGRSQACPIYESPKLSVEEQFQIMQMEVWGFKSRGGESSSGKDGTSSPSSVYRSNPNKIEYKPSTPTIDKKKVDTKDEKRVDKPRRNTFSIFKKKEKKEDDSSSGSSSSETPPRAHSPSPMDNKRIQELEEEVLKLKNELEKERTKNSSLLQTYKLDESKKEESPSIREKKGKKREEGKER